MFLFFLKKGFTSHKEMLNEAQSMSLGNLAYIVTCLYSQAVTGICDV